MKDGPGRPGRAWLGGGGRGARGTQLRRHNLSTLLEHLHLTGPSSRSELAETTGLNRSTIADLVEELVGLGFARESGAVTGPGPGRPSPIVHPQAEGAVVLAVELAVDSFAVATIGLGGTILAEQRVAHPRQPTSPPVKVAEIATAATPLLDTLPHGSVHGIGVAVVGLTRRTDGLVHLAPNLGWRDVPLGQLLWDALDHPALVGDVDVLVANEADLGALAEHRRGAGRGVPDLVFVSGEVGIGIGVISGGRPLLGATGYAGEAGHMLVNPTGRLCGCGARGCWETEAGELALLRHAGVSADLPGPAAVAEVLERAERDDRAALDAIAEVGWWLGLGAGDLVNLFNPRLIAVGGLPQRLFDRFEDSLRAGLSSRALAVAERLVELAPSQLGVDAPLIGAGELAFDRLLADPAAHAPSVAGA